MTDRKFSVYVLRRKDNNSVFYVGETSCPDRRLAQHMDGLGGHTRPIIEWARSHGVAVEMQIVAEFGTRKEARQYETELLDRAWRKSYWLANHFITPTSDARRYGRRWGDDERQQVREMYETRRMTIAEIAQSLERSFGSVSNQLRKMDVAIQWQNPDLSEFIVRPNNRA